MPWRVALVKTHTWSHAPSYAQQALLAYADTLRKQGMDVREVELPQGMAQSHEIHATIYNKALSYYFSSEHEKPSFVSPVMNELIAAGEQVTPAAYEAALLAQTELIYQMDEFFTDYDVVLSLSTAGEAPPREVTELPDPALMWTLTHLPVVSVPLFTSPSGLPFGMQVTARKYNDYRLLAFLDDLRKQKLIPSVAGFCTKSA